MNKTDFQHKLKAIALDLAALERDAKKLKQDCDELFDYFATEERTNRRDGKDNNNNT